MDALNQINEARTRGSNAMADETKTPDGETVKADAETVKQYSEEEFKKVVEERQRLKDKLRKIEEAEIKAKEAKMAEDGQLKELLSKAQEERDAARKEAEAFREYKAKQRDSLIAKLSDEEKEIAADIQDLDKLQKFVARVTETKEQPYNARGSTKAPPPATLEQQLAQAIKDGRPMHEIVMLKRQIFEAQNK